MEDDNLIRYDLIAKALDFYKGLGYKEINVPWAVRPEVSDITCPSPDLAYASKLLDNDVLVGSAEQSMIQMMIDGVLPHGKYVAVTPCFRNEPVLDQYHQKYFMKVEIFTAGASASAKMMYDAKEFFKTLTNKNIDIEPHKHEMGFDLEIDGVEIGSYNFRSFGNIKWSCGTGLALPRFTKVM